ncbi:amidohydrolase family protein [Novosphingobium bradum]|uniref:Amidohydrolase family protein n=1 Tax=Novosphingobium bradum TaxID=1737444 RepID=A0ABV7IPK9_9SPHN
MRTVHSGIVDTLIGFRAERHFKEIAALRDSDKNTHHPHGYMFRDIPPELTPDEDPQAAITETLDLMDQHGIEYGLVSLSDERVAEAARRHPNRILTTLQVDGNQGMDAVRAIVRAKEENDIRAVNIFPVGTVPQIPINDKLWYPIYAKCIELDIPVFTTAGVPGPRVKMMAQYTGLLDEVCYDFPELKIVMRHGAEPWVDLAVKLMLKWPNLYYSTSAFAPKYYPKEIVDYANTRGADKIIYAGYFPYGLTLDRIFSEMDQVPFKDHVWPKFLSDNARKLLKLPAIDRP